MKIQSSRQTMTLTDWQFSRRKDQSKTNHWNEQLLKILVDKVLLIKSTKNLPNTFWKWEIHKILKSSCKLNKISSQKIKFWVDIHFWRDERWILSYCSTSFNHWISESIFPCAVCVGLVWLILYYWPQPVSHGWTGSFLTELQWVFAKLRSGSSWNFVPVFLLGCRGRRS